MTVLMMIRDVTNNVPLVLSTLEIAKLETVIITLAFLLQLSRVSVHNLH